MFFENQQTQIESLILFAFSPLVAALIYADAQYKINAMTSHEWSVVAQFIPFVRKVAQIEYLIYTQKQCERF